MKKTHRIIVIFDRIISVSFFLAGAVVVLQTFTVAGATIMRYLTRFSITGVEPFTEWGILYLTYLSAAWVLRNEGHVKMDVLTSRLQPRTQNVLLIVTSIICMVLCLLLTWYGVTTTWDSWVNHVTDMNKLLGFPKAIILAIIPVGSLLLSIQFLRRAYAAWRGMPAPGAGVSADYF